MNPPMEMIKAVSNIVDCLEKGKKAKSMNELLPIMMLLPPLEMAIDDFVQKKLKPIHEAIEEGRNPFDEKSDLSSEDKPSVDWDNILKGFKPGEAN